jgi:SAM-dependent methyltransferase
MVDWLTSLPQRLAASVKETEKMRSLTRFFLAVLVVVVLVAPLAAQQKPLRDPDVVFVPTPQEVVDKMLELANVKPGDVLYDLGCGDGRTVITAAKLGARAIGIDINPERIKDSNENAAKNGMTGKVTFRLEDLFEADFKDATVVTLYLLPSLNVKLRPKLWKELKPGTRIVSHDFDMGDWKADKTVDMDGHTIYFWTVPANPPVVHD